MADDAGTRTRRRRCTRRTLTVALLLALSLAPAAHGSEFPRIKVAELTTGRIHVERSGIFEDLVWADAETLLAVKAPEDERDPYVLLRSRPRPGRGDPPPERMPMPIEVGELGFTEDASGYLAVHGRRRGAEIVLHAIDGTVRTRLFTFAHPEAVFVAGTLSRDGRLAALSTEERLIVVDATNGATLLERPIGRDNGTGAPAFSPDGRALVAFDGMRLVHVDVASGNVRRLGTRRFADVAWSAAGHLAAIRWSGQQIDLLSPQTGSPLRTGVGRLKAWSMTWSPDGRRLAFSFSRYDGYDGVGIYDVDRRRVRTVHKPILNSISFLRWSPDGRRLAWFAGW